MIMSWWIDEDALHGIRTHGLSLQAMNAHASDRVVTGIGNKHRGGAPDPPARIRELPGSNFGPDMG
jgi:hypothetical protein